MFGCILDNFFAFIDHWINALLLVTFSFQELIGNYIYMEEYFMRETVMKVSFHGNKYLNTSREEQKRVSLACHATFFDEKLDGRLFKLGKLIMFVAVLKVL